jgi:alkanesulfonate monooxygenase SsuD/methylene tetrahydromethanopterin reductase-like flavin-dependent oxidoreductase (luciferase family)
VRVGIGLPTTVPGRGRQSLVEWSRRAETGPFTSLGVLDRVSFDSLDPFVALSAAAAVTERVSLVTMVVIAPLRPSALLAKQAASVDALSGGRLVLGTSIGAREDDYDVTGVPHRGRGDRLSEQLVDLRDAWEAGRITPRLGRPDGPRLLVGGSSGVAFARAARAGDGYVHGGGPPRAFASAAARALAAWEDFERPGRPELWGQGYFALGDVDTLAEGESYLLDYYAFTGPFAERIAATNLTSARAVVDFVRGYEDAGCDELVLLPTVASLHQVDRLAEALAAA